MEKSKKASQVEFRPIVNGQIQPLPEHWFGERVEIQTSAGVVRIGDLIDTNDLGVTVEDVHGEAIGVRWEDVDLIRGPGPS